MAKRKSLILGLTLFLLLYGILYLLVEDEFVPAELDAFTPAPPKEAIVKRRYGNIQTKEDLFSTCQLTVYDPFHGGINKTIENHNPLKGCNRNYASATRLDQNGLLTIGPAFWHDDGVRCSARCQYMAHGSRLSAGWWHSVDPANGLKLDCEFIYTECMDAHGNIFDRDLHVQMRETEFKSYNGPAEKEDPKFAKNWRPDVHIVVLDSVASTQARRTLPKTIKYIEERFGGVFMHHLNRVGVNSAPNGFALLTGKRIQKVDRTMVGGSILNVEMEKDQTCWDYLDGVPLIFQDYEKLGYKTMYTTDWGDIWTYPNCYGFYYQPFTNEPAAIPEIIEKNKLLKENLKAKCVEDWHLMLKYHGQFARSYKNNPKFALTWIVQPAHDDPNRLWHADDGLEKFFLENEKTLDKSFVFFIGDHGPRFGDLVLTELGRREVDNPLLMVAVPNFLRKNKQLMKNLREKQTGLLTHYDVYATFQDILRNAHLTNFTKFDCEEVLRPNPSSGNSLLRPLGPHKNRTCVNTPIPTDYCMCEFEKSEKDPSKFIAMGHFAVQAINELLQKEGLANLCQTLRLDKVRTVTAYEPEKALKLYEIQFSALPSKGIYKAMIEIAPDGSFVSSGIIDRMNLYGKGADCVAINYPEMKPLCFCNQSFSLRLRNAVCSILGC